MSAPALDALVRACLPLAADGTDPEALAALLAWTVRPRRSLEALRRRALDAGVTADRAGPRLHDWTLAEVDAGDAAAATGLVAAWRRHGCRLSLVGDPGYPQRLAEGWPSSDGPVLLAAAGTVPDAVASVAFVGARRATAYGTGVTAWLAEAAAAAGVHVVSGGAVGIDAAAHRAALRQPGATTVVLGCGHAVPYPRAHARPGGLFAGIVAAGGAVISEQLPSVPPRAGIVRARNRIVAGLADVVVVVEGGPRSGSLLTASAALERGRPVLAVPGDVRAPGSHAPHRLLREGAAPCTEPADLLEVLGLGGGATAWQPATGGPAASPATSVLPPGLRTALEVAWPRARPLDDLLAGTDLAAGPALAAITRAQLAGEVVERPDGLVLRQDPGAERSRRGDRPVAPNA
ncbi:MAG: DNA-processing protein DprA [Nitriliruptoraceae bacterium]